MPKLKLWFSSDNSPQLLKTEFEHPLLSEKRTAVRGKSAGAYHDTATFQWTGAVQALCMLCLNKDEVLEGYQGSPASSLDYALSKQPMWLLEMFGWDVNGESLARRIIKRTNTSRKMQAPISLSLSKECEVEIIQEGKSESVLERMIFREARSSLFVTNVFSSSGYKKMIKSVLANPSFIEIAGSNARHLTNVDADLVFSKKLGFSGSEAEIRKNLSGNKEINIAVPIPLVGSLTILNYLRYVKGYNININARFPHAQEIVKRINTGDIQPDICILGIAPVGTLLSSRLIKQYQAIMFMPKVANRIVAPKTAEKINSGHYVFLKDDPSTASFYFDDLNRRSLIEKNKVSIESMEPSDVMGFLKHADSNLKAVLFFPYTDFNEIYNDCKFIDQPSQNENWSEVVMFANRSSLASKKMHYLNLAIRDAWLSLMEEPKVFAKMIKQISNDSLQMKFMKRCGGLYLNESLQVTPSHS